MYSCVNVAKRIKTTVNVQICITRSIFYSLSTENKSSDLLGFPTWTDRSNYFLWINIHGVQ